MTIGLKEAEIRPDHLLQAYLRLSARDARAFFPDPRSLARRLCPGCAASDGTVLFEKHGFPIERCPRCRTLYVNPSPTGAQLAEFYRDSESAQYWANVFFPAVAEARRDRIFAPRAERLLSFAADQGVALGTVVDVGAGSGLFLEELKARAPKVRCRAVEPGRDFAAALATKGIEVHEGFVESLAAEGRWSECADAVVSFEVVEHLPEPRAFFAAVAALARPGGLVLVSGLCGDGFDIQVLGARANAVSPPHHLTFLSREGVERLVKEANLELIAFETPGKLDVEIAQKALAAEPGAVKDGFLRHLLSEADESARIAFQQFLAANRLSSHMWIFARRTGSDGPDPTAATP
jgi:SAM-dependent methyltransferase